MKPSATTAAATAFCVAEIEGPGGKLWIDGNGKITAGNGSLGLPKPNAFSLTQIDDCPGATPTCKALCYVHNLEKFAAPVHALYRRNSETIRKILGRSGSDEWARLLGRWIETNCRGGFRWHVSGDVFSRDYAEWIVAVCRQSPSVAHWIYTRSFDAVDLLAHQANLTLNLSADRDNYAEARETATRFGLRLCYVTDDGVLPGDLRDGEVIFPDYRLRGGTAEGFAWFEALPPHYKSYVCPVDYHGKAENRRCGPCDRCLKKF